MTDLLSYVTLGFIPAFLLLDAFRGTRHYEKPTWWRTRMLLATAFVTAGSLWIGAFWAATFDGAHLIDGAPLGTWGGSIIGILAYELVHYGYHRMAHRYDWLWRLAHQMHHSVEAMDAFSASYLHPIDLFFFTTWGSVVFFPVLGLTVEAGAIAAAWLGFNAMFQHANIRTPRWLGYLIQRPESHVVHHQLGRHQYNYANLPLWDMVFGTFRNPHDADGVEAGFYTGASARVLDMLLFRDVSKPESPARTRSTARDRAVLSDGNAV